MMQYRFLTLFAALPWLLGANAIAGGFSYSGAHADLVNHTIVDIGVLAVERDQYSIAEKARSLTPSTNEKLYSVGASCFYSNLNFSSTPAMIVADRQGLKKVAIFNSDGNNIEVKLHFFRLLSCNDVKNSNNQRTMDEMKTMIEGIERQRQQNLHLRR